MTHPSSRVRPLPNWEEYRRELYVDRSQLQEELRAWFGEPTPKEPIRSIIGPPGVGKSWVLSHIKDDVAAIRSSPERPHGVWLSQAKELINPSMHEQIKQDLIRAVHNCCPDLDFPDGTLPTLETIITNLSHRLSLQCPDSVFLLLVDGCDDLPSLEVFDELQRKILVKFFDTGANCFRMIIARRGDLTDYELKLKNRNIALEAFEDLMKGPSAQIEKFLDYHDPGETLSDDSTKTWLSAYHHYRWNHPYINAFLLAHHIQTGTTLTSNILAECCKSTINRPTISPAGSATRQPFISDDEFETLVLVAASLPDSWHHSEYRKLTGGYLPLAHLARGVILNIPGSDGKPNPTYRIIDGLRELLRDLAAIRQKELKL